MFNNKSLGDMQFKDYLKTKLPFFVATSALFVLASCGSYQYAGYDNDGIYSSDKRSTEEVPVEETTTSASNENTYYENYFAEKSREYEEVAQESEIFTDIDSYESGTQVSDSTEVEILDYNTGRAGWGSADHTELVININSGFNNFWWWDNPWGWNRWNRWGWGWNSWNWRWGYNNPYWYYGFRAAWQFGPYWCPPNNGFFGGNYYYRNGYRNYSRRGLAYNYGRRGNSLYSSPIGRRNTTLSRGTNLRRNTTTRPRVSTSGNTRPRVSTSGNTRPRVSTPRSTRPRVSTPRSSRPRVSTPRSTRPRVSTPRSSRPRVNSSSRPSRSFSSSPSRSSRSSGSRGRRN